MKIELFQFIDESLELLKDYNRILEEIAENSVKTLRELFDYDDSFVNITYRIKSSHSLREKIIKNNLYLQCEDPEKMILSLSDLIGIRIECRFIKEEEHIYKEILNKFREYDRNGYYKINDDIPIKLRLADKQPQIQKNGFEIYKIDGIYEYGKNRFNFELQIKSMVNVFWGEIDHRILYKNYSYMSTEGFFKEIMASIKDSLSMIDRQLLILYDYVSSLDASAVDSAKTQLNSLLSKIIHDVFSNKVKDKFGFVFNFKDSSDLIVDYLQTKVIKNKDFSYGDNFVKLINKVNEVSFKEINIEEYILLDENIKYFDKVTEKLGSRIVEVINKDFKWHLIINIISEIEDSTHKKSFEDFMNFIRYKFSLEFISISEIFNISDENIYDLENSVLDVVIEKFQTRSTIDFLMNKCISAIRNEYEILYRESEDRPDTVSHEIIKDGIIKRLGEIE